MQITYRRGDLITAAENLIIHGCNAQGQMGAGVALAIRLRMPFAYNAYLAAFKSRGLTLGDVIWAIDVGHGRPMIVGNAITQKFYGSGSLFVNYDAVLMCIQRVNDFVRRSHETIQIAGMPRIEAVGMPMIGAGLGGGDWGEISAIIEAESHDFTPVVYQL